MYIIGISAYYHDSSVALFRNGVLIFACEEEKFSGIKHDKSFPIQTLTYIYQIYKIKKEQVDSICFYENPKLKRDRVISNIKKQFIKNPFYSIISFFDSFNNFNKIDKQLKKYCDNVFYSEHHLSHQYYSFYSSPYDDAVMLSIDGVGESTTTSMGVLNGKEIINRSISEYPHSLGLFYSAMTSFLGFKPNEGEYKVMGLASYGNPKKYIDRVQNLITYNDGSLKCDMEVFDWDKSNKTMFNHKLGELLEMDPRTPETELTPDHMDLAASVQKLYEQIFFKMLETVAMFSENRNLCLSGGCAYNGTANGKVVNDSSFNSLWISPAPSDAGSSVGACLHYMVSVNIIKGKVTKNPFIGPLYFKYSIADTVIGVKKTYKYPNEKKLIEHVAKHIHNGKVVGWYTGHCEFGARALGNRSILASPLIPDMKDRINKVIKKREGFRPFAPMVIKEKQHDYFIMSDDIPYMNQVVQVKPEYRDILVATTHIDGSARVQTVYKNTFVHDLLVEFEKLSGYPILLNTSFNIKDKTMVLSPKDAINTFYETDMDLLVMGNYVIYK